MLIQDLFENHYSIYKKLIENIEQTKNLSRREAINLAGRLRKENKAVGSAFNFELSSEGYDFWYFVDSESTYIEKEDLKYIKTLDESKQEDSKDEDRKWNVLEIKEERVIIYIDSEDEFNILINAYKENTGKDTFFFKEAEYKGRYYYMPSETTYSSESSSDTFGYYSEQYDTAISFKDTIYYKKTKSKTKKTQTGMKTIDEQILDKVSEHVESPEVLEVIKNATKEQLDAWGIAPKNITLEVVTPKATKKIENSHFKTEVVLRSISAKVPVALVGPAGSGKTTCVSSVAEALSLEFYSKSVSVQTGVHEFFGYQDANGNYVRTLFREAYENGGVFLLDEFDAGNPNVLAALNQATANGSCAFPDGMINRHEDFIIVMAGNTFGHGANSEYVGRNKIDAATLDRFVFIEFPYDEDFEMKLCTNPTWCKEVQAFRKKVTDKKVKTIISPRATFYGEKLIEQGMDLKTVRDITIYKGLNSKELELLK